MTRLSRRAVARPALVLGVALALAAAAGLASFARSAAAGDPPSATAPADDAKDRAGPGVAFVPKGTPFADVLATAKKDGKLVFLDVSTSWCGACRVLEREVFARASVAEALEGFVALAVDAEEGEGKTLAERFRVFAFPTLVVTDAEGVEVDRLLGASPPAEFKAEIARIVRGEGTLAALRKALAERPDDLAAAIALGKKEAWSDPDGATARLDAVLAKVAGKDRALEAKALDALVVASDVTGPSPRALDAVERLLTELGDLPEAQAAFARVGMFATADPARALAFLAKARPHATGPETLGMLDDLAVAVHVRAAEDALRRRAAAAGDDADALNFVAWTAFERRLALDDAVDWAQRAVERSGRRAEVLDTLGNLLHALGRTAEAIVIEEEAAAKATDERERRAYAAHAAEWKAVVAARDAAGVVPATPLVPAAPPAAPEAPKAPAPGGGACGGGK